MTALAARDAYRLWAPTYADETAISWLEERLARALTPPLDGLRLLDAGCGTGRRLQGTPAKLAVGVDISPEMLRAGDALAPLARRLVGDVRDLPLEDASFDVIWCRLVLGHLPDCRRAYEELARVAAPGAVLIVTDFHRTAFEAGHRRTFRSGGEVIEVEHYVHDVADQVAAAAEAGLEPIDQREAAIGPEVRHFYVEAGKPALFHAHLGLPVVSALAFRREA